MSSRDRIGQRIREARHRAGLTQQQLAGERYTKAYVSALETGIARPSMVALSYLSERLSLPASHFIDEANPAWTRLEVDMRLAAGEWQAAADGYEALLDDAPDDAMRADLLRGLAEAIGAAGPRQGGDRGRRPRRRGCTPRPAARPMRRSPATGWPTASTSPTTSRMRAACSPPCSSRSVVASRSSRTSRCAC